MAAIYRFLGTHEVFIYILLAIGALFVLRWLWRSWNEWRQALYSLEREFALRRIGQAAATLMLIVVAFCGELLTASFIVPKLPAVLLVPSSTPNMVIPPMGTIPPELATTLQMTPNQVEGKGGEGGCIDEQVNIANPKSGDEVRGTVEIRGTVNIPDFGFYKYEVTPMGTESWITISAGRARVVNGPLGQWDTAPLPAGDYQLRLVVSDNQGQSLEPCIIQVRVIPQT